MIAGYLTARTTDIAQVEVQKGKPKILNTQHFNNNEFSDFDSLLSLYIRKSHVEKDSICLGVAGPVIDNSVTATNIPWKISADRIREKYGFDISNQPPGLYLLEVYTDSNRFSAKIN